MFIGYFDLTIYFDPNNVGHLILKIKNLWDNLIETSAKFYSLSVARQPLHKAPISD